MRAQTILFLFVDRVSGMLDCRPYRGGGEGNPKRLVEAASLAFSNRSNFLTIRGMTSAIGCTEFSLGTVILGLIAVVVQRFLKCSFSICCCTWLRNSSGCATL